jgi:hypothetical protein
MMKTHHTLTPTETAIPPIGEFASEGIDITAEQLMVIIR